MELLTTLMTICLGCILLTMYFSRRLDEPDRISGGMIRYPKTPVVIFWIVVIVISGYRYGFCDTGVYRNLCGRIGTDWDAAWDENFPITDVGFNLLMIFINKLGFHPQYIIVFTSILTFAIYGIYLYKYSTDVPYSMMLFLLLTYLTMINGIRQVLAAAVIFWGLPFLRDRRFWPYAALVLLAGTIHASAMIMLPLYFVLSGERMNWKLGLFYGCVLVFFVAPGFADILLGSLLEDSTYREYLQVDSQMGIMRLLVAMVPAGVAIVYGYVEYKNALVRGYYTYNDRLTDVLINMQLVSFGFTMLGLRMVYFARLSMYLDGGFVLLLPRAIKGAFHDHSARFVKLVSIALYTIYFLYQVTTYESYGYFNDFRMEWVWG